MSCTTEMSFLQGEPDPRTESKVAQVLPPLHRKMRLKVPREQGTGYRAPSSSTCSNTKGMPKTAVPQYSLWLTLVHSWEREAWQLLCIALPFMTSNCWLGQDGHVAKMLRKSGINALLYHRLPTWLQQTALPPQVPTCRKGQQQYLILLSLCCLRSAGQWLPLNM